MKNIRSVLISMTAGAAAIFALSLPAAAEAPSEWRIGALFSFSGSGAFLGQETFLGAEIASEMINDQGGIGGAPIVWEKADASTPAQARTEASRLANAGIKVVFGTNNSGLAMAASQLLERNKVIFWEPGASTDELTKQGYKYTFRTVPAGAQWGQTLADFAIDELAPVMGVDKDKLHVAIKYEDGAFGNSIGRVLTERLEERGVAIAANEQYSARSTDLSSLVLKLKESNPDIVLSTDYPNDAILFARQSKELGYDNRAIVGWAGIAFDKFGADLGEFAEGMMSINMLMDVDPSKLPEETRKIRDEFRDRYQKKTGRVPNAFATVGFDSAWALFKYALPKAGSYDSDAIREAAMSLDLPEGALTQGWGVKFSDGTAGSDLGQNERAHLGITQWQDGKLVLVSPHNLASGTLRKP